MNPESIDRIEHSIYTPLEKKYLKVQFVKVAFMGYRTKRFFQ